MQRSKTDAIPGGKTEPVPACLDARHPGPDCPQAAAGSRYAPLPNGGPNPSLGAIVQTARALADPTRVKILKLLAGRELCGCELAAALQTSQAAISQHMRRLKEAGLVCERRRSQWAFYSLAPGQPEQIAARLQWLWHTPAAGLPALAAAEQRLQASSADPAVRHCRVDVRNEESRGPHRGVRK